MIARCSSALPIFTRIRKSSLTPNDSIRIASAAPGRRHQHGWRSVAERRRCIGAEFAIAEMDIVLRTVLQNFQIQTDAAADEKSYFRGVAHSPKLGGRVISEPANVAHHVDPADQTIARAAARNPLQCRRRHRRELGDPLCLLLRAASRHEGARPCVCAGADESSDLRGANGHRSTAGCESDVKGRVCHSRLCRPTARSVKRSDRRQRTPGYGSSTR